MDDARRVWYLHEGGGWLFVDRAPDLGRLFSDCKTSVLCVQVRDANGVWSTARPEDDPEWQASLAAAMGE